jgi:hypothetical protein
MAIEDGQPEIFTPTWAQTWHAVIRPLLPMNLLLLGLCWAIGYVLGGPLWSVLLPVLVVGATTLLARIGTRSLRVRVSGYGIELLRGSRSRGVAWPNLDRVELLTRRGSPVVGPRGVAGVVAGASMASYGSANTGPGLIGAGSVLTRPTPADLARQPPRERILLPLFSVDRRWHAGRIGDWVRAYRPDLMADLPAGQPPHSTSAG